MCACSTWRLAPPHHPSSTTLRESHTMSFTIPRALHFLTRVRVFDPYPFLPASLIPLSSEIGTNKIATDRYWPGLSVKVFQTFQLVPSWLGSCLTRGRGSHGARPVHLIITMIKWTRTSRVSVKNSFSPQRHPHTLHPTPYTLNPTPYTLLNLTPYTRSGARGGTGKRCQGWGVRGREGRQEGDQGTPQPSTPNSKP